MRCLYRRARLVSLIAADARAETLAVIAAVVTFISTLDMVYDTPRWSAEHANLSRRFAELEARIVSAEPNKANYDRCYVERLRIEQDEPPQRPVVSVLSHNDQVLAADKGALYDVALWRRLAGNYLAVEAKPEKGKTLPIT